MTRLIIAFFAAAVIGVTGILPAFAGNEFSRAWHSKNSSIVLDAYEYTPLDWSKIKKNKRLAGFINKASDGLPPKIKCGSNVLCRVKWRRYSAARELYHTRKVLAKTLGLKWGAYHLGRPGNPIQQAQHFLWFTQPDKDDLLALDIEDNRPDKWMSLKDAERFAIYVKKRMGRYPVLYTNHSTAKTIAHNRDKYPVLSRLNLWYARYKPSMVGAFPMGHWKSYTLWQFSSMTNCTKRRCPWRIRGADNFIDVNVVVMPPSELRKKWPFAELNAGQPPEMEFDSEPSLALAYAGAAKKGPVDPLELMQTRLPHKQEHINVLVKPKVKAVAKETEAGSAVMAWRGRATVPKWRPGASFARHKEIRSSDGVLTAVMAKRPLPILRAPESKPAVVEVAKARPPRLVKPELVEPPQLVATPVGVEIVAALSVGAVSSEVVAAAPTKVVVEAGPVVNIKLAEVAPEVEQIEEKTAIAEMAWAGNLVAPKWRSGVSFASRDELHTSDQALAAIMAIRPIPVNVAVVARPKVVNRVVAFSLLPTEEKGALVKMAWNGRKVVPTWRPGTSIDRAVEYRSSDQIVASLMRNRAVPVFAPIVVASAKPVEVIADKPRPVVVAKLEPVVMAWAGKPITPKWRPATSFARGSELRSSDQALAVVMLKRPVPFFLPKAAASQPLATDDQVVASVVRSKASNPIQQTAFDHEAVLVQTASLKIEYRAMDIKFRPVTMTWGETASFPKWRPGAKIIRRVEYKTSDDIVMTLMRRRAAPFFETARQLDSEFINVATSEAMQPLGRNRAPAKAVIFQSKLTRSPSRGGENI